MGVGDSVVTRRNQRGLATGRGWVKNGDQWTVVGVRRDGAIDVRRTNGTGRATLPAAYVREHVELGYATTAHRAQGRTVDTAHAFVSATTLREPLYVMATRGRESNRLYVDTMYDPDVATSHEPPDELAPADVLRYVLASSGADKSATLTITEEWANSHSITRLWAEYDTIARHANEERYAAMVASCGLTAAEAETVRISAAWGPLMSAFRDAEALGLDLDRAVPALVQGRTISSADDIAALLHGRVTKWIGAADSRRQPDSIVGIGPAVVGVTDPDIEQALQDRRTLIEERARSLTLNALQKGEPWTLSVGRPPADPARREEWLRELDTVAAYRDRWQVIAGSVLGGEPRSREQHPGARRGRGFGLRRFASTNIETGIRPTLRSVLKSRHQQAFPLTFRYELVAGAAGSGRLYLRNRARKTPEPEEASPRRPARSVLLAMLRARWVDVHADRWATRQREQT